MSEEQVRSVIDPAFRARRVDVPDDQNAFVAMVNARKRFEGKLRDIEVLGEERRFTAAELARAKTYLETNQQALAEFFAATRLSFLQTQLWYHNSPLNEVFEWMGVCSMAVAPTLLAVETRDRQMLVTRIGDLVNFYLLLSKLDSSFIYYEWARSYGKEILRALRRACASGLLTWREVELLLGRLPIDSGATRVLQQTIRNRFQELVRELLKEQHLVTSPLDFSAPVNESMGRLDVLETARLASRQYRLALEASATPWKKGRWLELEASTENYIRLVKEPPKKGGSWQDQLKHRLAMSASSNSVGAWFLSIPVLPGDGRELQFEPQMVHDMTRLSLAIQVFRGRFGSYPQTLDDLVRKGLLASLPLDPVTERPYRYDSKRSILWSVGFDGVDDGGKVGDFSVGCGL